LSISFSTRHCIDKHHGGPVTLKLLFDHKTNEDILNEPETQAVFVQINNRNKGQIKTMPDCFEMATGRKMEHTTADKETCCLFY
jgi:hypothetical protein